MRVTDYASMRICRCVTARSQTWKRAVTRLREAAREREREEGQPSCGVTRCTGLPTNVNEMATVSVLVPWLEKMSIFHKPPT